MFDLEAALPSAGRLTQPFWNYCKRGNQNKINVQSELRSFAVLHNGSKMSKYL